MARAWRSRRTRLLGAALVLAAIAVSTAAIAALNAGGNGAASSGTYAKGSMTVPLYRGVGVPFELTVMRTPNNCGRNVTLTMRWDEENNLVTLRLRGKGVLTPHPTFVRTEGVNYFPNRFWPEAKDIVQGRYQFWVISPSEEILFFYDPMTLDLLGSEKDFDTPPPAIPVLIPALTGVGSPLFQPDANGDLDFQWTFPYDRVVRGDRPDLGHHYITFPPQNLCEANPFRYDLSTTRPYISRPQPTADARTFGDLLKAGFAFDLTVEPAEYATEPPYTTLVGTYSNATLFGGAVPNGWIMDFDHIFGNNAPPIRPWESAGRCEDWFRPVHTRGLNFCGGAQ